MALSVESVQSACAPHVDLYCSLSQLTPEFSSNFDSQSIAGLEEKYSSSRRLTGSFLRHKHTISSSKLHIFGEHVDQCLENIWRKKLIPSENLIPSCNESLTLLDERIETYNFILSWKRIFLPLVSFHFFLWIVLWKKATSEPYLWPPHRQVIITVSMTIATSHFHLWTKYWLSWSLS